MKAKPSTEEELVAAFDTLFDEIPMPATEEEIDKELTEAGYDPNAIAQQMAALAATALAESPYHWRKRAQSGMESAKAAREAFSTSRPLERSSIITAIQNIVATSIGSTLAGAYYRNLEEISDDDLLTLLADLEFLAEEQNRP